MTRLLVLPVALLCGCGDPATPSPEIVWSPATSDVSPESEDSFVAVEPSWSAQVEAVRAGTSSEIRIALPVTSPQFRELADGCDGLTVLVLEEASLENGDLAVLPTLSRLRWIKLPFEIDDEGATAIGRCRSLEIVNLPQTSITDAGMTRIAELPRLELLRVQSPHVTDAGLEALTGLSRLRFLHLLDASITDAGLEQIAAIETLESFYLDGATRTTDDGLRSLLTERPDLHFHKDQYHIPGDPNSHPHD